MLSFESEDLPIISTKRPRGIGLVRKIGMLNIPVLLCYGNSPIPQALPEGFFVQTKARKEKTGGKKNGS